jgi:hypothetical protein
MSDVIGNPLDIRLNVGSDQRMGALADRSSRSRNNPLIQRRAASRLASLGGAPSVASARASGANDAPPISTAFREPPAETDAWWLSRSEEPTFARRRIAISEASVRALEGATEVAIEFNGATFVGASIVATDDGYLLDLGEALAAEMAEVLDEDDGLEVEPVVGKGRPTIAIHPYVDPGDDDL